MSKSEFQLAIEKQTGLSIEEISNMSLHDMRLLNEKQNKKPMTFIGSSLLRLLSKADVEKMVDEAIK